MRICQSQYAWKRNYSNATVFEHNLHFDKFDLPRERKNIMASTTEYLNYILDQLSLLEDISYRAMMGEYIIYYRGKVVGGIYDDRFLIKPVKAAENLMPDAEREIPYEGAKEMLLVDNVEDREFLAGLLEDMYDELPSPKGKR